MAESSLVSLFLLNCNFTTMGEGRGWGRKSFPKAGEIKAEIRIEKQCGVSFEGVYFSARFIAGSEDGNRRRKR